MKSKILLGFGVLAVTLAVLPMFAAFEAHVINVTAQIENALNVQTDALDFGTVFPQEHLNKTLDIRLSDSFSLAGRVDDVEYIIRQKPKCAITSNNGQSFDSENTATGHIVASSTQPGGYAIDCGNPTRELTTGESWGVLPSLCEYISKEPDNDPTLGNDETTPSFHQPWTWDSVNGVVVWNDTDGYLSKDALDTEDHWTIDLSVPCFGGYCAQDWENWVRGINPQADPSQYTQPIGNEHKVFGCDLWIEVTGVSENPLLVIARNSTDFDIDDNGDPADDFSSFTTLGTNVVASTTYKYSVNTVSTSDSSIPTVQWKITIDGPAALSVGNVHVDEVGWEDPANNSTSVFHYPMSVIGGNLVAKGSCTDAGDHSDACTVDDFDVDPLDNFTNVDSIHFADSAPNGIYTIKRQLVDTGTGNPVSNELVVATVTK